MCTLCTLCYEIMKPVQHARIRVEASKIGASLDWSHTAHA